MSRAPLLVLCTCPDHATGTRIAEALVSQHHAACVSIIPGVTSVYRWRDAVETASECQLLIKTRSDAYAALESALRTLHPYELPEIIAVPVTQGLDAYLDWIQTCTDGSP